MAARIAHLSDVHFGCHDEKVVAGANAWLQEQQPDLIIVSGFNVFPAEVEEVLAEHRTFRPAPKRGFHVEAVGEGSFRVVGAGIERLLARYDPDNEEAMAYLEHRLTRIGVIGALQDAGFEPGDDVEIGGVIFELDPEA